MYFDSLTQLSILLESIKTGAANPLSDYDIRTGIANYFSDIDSLEESTLDHAVEIFKQTDSMHNETLNMAGMMFMINGIDMFYNGKKELKEFKII